MLFYAAVGPGLGLAAQSLGCHLVQLEHRASITFESLASAPVAAGWNVLVDNFDSRFL